MRALPAEPAAIVADADGEQRIADVRERELEAINRTPVEALCFHKIGSLETMHDQDLPTL